MPQSAFVDVRKAYLIRAVFRETLKRVPQKAEATIDEIARAFGESFHLHSSLATLTPLISQLDEERQLTQTMDCISR